MSRMMWEACNEEKKEPIKINYLINGEVKKIEGEINALPTFAWEAYSLFSNLSLLLLNV